MAEQQDSLFEQIEDTPSDERPEEARASEKEWSLLEQRFSYALQYPTTIGPLFITALSLMLIVLQQWWLPGALLWALFYLALATAVVSFVALYSLQYEREYQKRENERANADFHDQNVRVE